LTALERTEGKIASLVTVVNQSDRPDLAAGELHRYLSEAVWFPTVLLPGQGIAWEAIDNTTARAKLSHAGISVSLEFQSSKDGEIVRAYTPQRCRERTCRRRGRATTGTMQKFAA
jgi:hypothetical protein